MRLRRLTRKTGYLPLLLVAGALIIGYLVQWRLYEVAPHNQMGVIYGSTAAVLLVLVAAWTLRRRLMRAAASLPLGKARSWLRFHISAGLLFLLLMFMHTGFNLPHGALAWWLWGLSLWTVLSGLFGLGLQRWIPRVLTSGLSVEVLFERIPTLIAELREKAEVLCRSCHPSVQVFYARNLAPSLAGPHHHLFYFLDVTGGIQNRLDRFNYLRGFLGDEDAARLDQLATIYRTKLEIDAHFTLQQALRLWLYLHVPPSLVLLVLVGVHLFTVLYY